MAGIRPEDSNIKIPALVHLTRLGYRFLPLSDADRDRETNILPADLRAAADRLNGVVLSDAAFGRLLSDIRRSLALEDLGSCFLDGLRYSWNGIRLIDFVRPENNTCRVMTELPCISGRNRFRPDITLFINGLPLAFIEVKSRGPGDGMRSEYHRMIHRVRNPNLRRFINETQIMVFSNDGEYDENDLIPKKGAFYATSAYDDLIFHHFEEEEKEIFDQLAPVDPEELSLILRDSRLEALADEPAFSAALSPNTPTHRLLTSLFHFRRLFFFLRYGITCLEEKEADGTLRLHKQIMRYPQLFAVRFLEHQLQRRQPGGHWCVGENGRVPLAAVQIRVLADYFGERNIPVRFFYLTDDPARIRGIRNAFEIRGFRIREILPGAGSPQAVPQEEFRIQSPVPPVAVACIRNNRDLPRKQQDNPSVRHVFFWDGTEGAYKMNEPVPDRLSAADPEAVLIVFSQPGDA